MLNASGIITMIHNKNPFLLRLLLATIREYHSCIGIVLFFIFPNSNELNLAFSRFW